MFKTLTPIEDWTSQDLSWQVNAACRGANPHLFDTVPPECDPFNEPRVQEALALCASCPVRGQCFVQANNTPGAVGVWGGGYIPETGYVQPKRAQERVWIGKSHR